MFARVTALALIVATSASPAAASGPDLFGFGARGQAMAGAVAATAEGFESVYYNPAGLAFDKRPTFTLGYQYAAFDLSANGASRDVRDAPSLTLGFGVPLPLGGFLKDRLSLGLGFVIPQASILIADLPRPGDPSFVLLENRAQTVTLQASLGVRITDWLSVGVGTLALASLVGDIRVEPNASGRIGSKVRDELLADYSLVAGVLARPMPELSVAFTYRSESRADFDLPITADLGSQFPVPIPQLAVNGTAQFDPAELTLEVAARPHPALLVAVAGSWERWSTFPTPLAYSATPPDYPPQPPPDFHDVFSLRVGAELDLAVSSEVRLLPRLGYHLAPSPVPAQTGFHNHLDGTRHVLGLGLGLRYDILRVDLAGQFQAVTARTHVKSADTPEDNPGFPSISGEGSVFLGTLQVGVEL
jgi:long-chain fatty acid transport protein